MSPYSHIIHLLALLAISTCASAWLSAGCSDSPAATQSRPAIKLDSTGHANRTLSGGRTYLLHVPQGSKEQSGPFAVVLSFHGAGGTSARQEVLSQFSYPSFRIAGMPVIAAYPQGADNAAENRTGVWYSAPYYNKTVDDVQFTKDIVADISSAYCVDLHRIYAAGKSNGGGFVAYMACRRDTAAVFAAFATVSPALYPESLAFGGCDPGRAVPILNSFGVQDQTIPYEGRTGAGGAYGQGSATVNVPLWRREWATRNGCKSTEPDRVDRPYNGTTREVWACEEEVVAYTTQYLGHSWPTTKALDTSGAPNNTALFNLTDPAISNFFGRHYLPVWVFEQRA